MNELCIGPESEILKVQMPCVSLDRPRVEYVDGCSVKIYWGHLMTNDIRNVKSRVFMQTGDDAIRHIEFCDRENDASVCTVYLKFLRF